MTLGFEANTGARIVGEKQETRPTRSVERTPDVAAHFQRRWPREGDRGSEKSQGVTSATERPAKRSSSLREPTTAVVVGIGSSNRPFRPFRRCLDEARSPMNLLREQASPYPSRGVGRTSDQVEGRRDDLDLRWQGSDERQTGWKRSRWELRGSISGLELLGGIPEGRQNRPYISRSALRTALPALPTRHLTSRRLILSSRRSA